MPQVMNNGKGYQLHINEIFLALSNMIISQQTHADNIKGTFSSLVDRARVDGSMYGDTKLYYDTDVLATDKWVQDSPKATNLLQLHRPKNPSVQAIFIDQFRQIPLTIDEYMSKRAWGSEGAFSQFQSVMTSWLRDTKRVYDATTFNAYLGTARSSVQDANVIAELGELDLASITADASLNTEEKGRLEAQTIGKYLADLIVNLEDVTRSFNDYGYLRSFNESDVAIVMNSKWLNKIRKVDLPTIFHDAGILTEIKEDKLPARYFGDVVTTDITAEQNDGTYRALVEWEALDENDERVAHAFAGELIPSGYAITMVLDPHDETQTRKLPVCYKENADIVCKVIYKNAVPYMSAFETGTSFFNGRNLSTNMYLTYGHNSLEYLLGKPFVTIEAKTE